MPKSRKSIKTNSRRTRKRRGGADNMAEFEFEVSLYADRHDESYVIEGNEDKIIKWYNGAMDVLDDSVVKNMKITHVRDNVFKGSFEKGPEARDNVLRMELDVFVNNDDDGNSPLKIGKYEYLVSGEVTKYPQ